MCFLLVFPYRKRQLFKILMSPFACGAPDTYQLIRINRNALKAHLAHGDQEVDADGDGYTAIGSCVGSADDCDDTNPDVNPGMEEICDNGIDDDCDGEVDEEDADCNVLPDPWIGR